MSEPGSGFLGGSSELAGFARQHAEHHLHLRWREGFWQKHARTRRDAIIPDLWISLSGDHAYWYAPQSFICFHIEDQVQALKVRHPHVEDGGAERRVLLQSSKRLPAIRHRHCLIAFRFNDGGHHPQR